MDQMEHPGERTRRWLAMVLIPLAAAALQLLLWPFVEPLIWVFFYPAIFIASRYAGLWGGISSTVWSAALAFYLFVPPRFALAGKPIQFLYQATIFLGMGVLFSVTHERLRRADREAAQALDSAAAANRELSNANAEVSRLLDSSRELDRLKTNFFATVSHELRTPLALILGPLERRLGSPGLSPEVRHDLELMQRNAQLLHRHVDDLLEVARLESGNAVMHYRVVDLAQLTLRVSSLFEALAAEHRIQLSVAAPERLRSTIDEEKIERVLVNLLSNAFRFTPDGGQIALVLSIEGDAARLRVDDSGPGIPADQRTVVFEPFRQLDGGANRKQGGTGLGLAIVRDFVALHHGAVGVTQADLGGARFELVLPLAAPAGVEVAPEREGPVAQAAIQVVQELGPNLTPAPSAPSRVSAPLILVVEDNPQMLAFLAETFREHYRVTTAANGKEGLARARAEHPDLIVCDMMMPEMTGEELVAVLRRAPEFDDVPIILLTAKADDTLRLRMLQHGVQEYLAKPFSTAEVLARVDGLLASQTRTRAALSKLYAQAQDDVATKARLLTEVNHRVKNNLISLIGMLLMEQRLSKTTGEPPGPEAFERFSRRVEALLAAHDLLSRVEWAGLPVAELANETIQRALLASGADRRVKLVLAPSDAVVSPRQAGALAMVLNELTTNSVKYARSGEDPFTIEIRTRLSGTSLTVTYRDDGQEYPPEVLRGERLGVGLRLNRELVEGTLRGSLTLSNDAGAVAEIRLEMEEAHRT